ncbi:putative reverse transcriptase domain-containing protein [Tanacetum coccineum]
MTAAQNNVVDQGRPAPKCNYYGMCHFGYCSAKCNKRGHKTKDCRARIVATGANALPIRACYECGDRNHDRSQCPKLANQRGGNATGHAYALRDAKQGQGSNVATGTFLLNNHYARVLFDSGSDKSFISSGFSHLIDIKPMRLYISYEVELANGKLVSINTVLRGCTLNLLNQLFEVDLMPIELYTFDVIIGMDWLVKHDALIVCGKKEVHIPVKGKMLVVKGNCDESRLKVVFPDDLPGLPPPRQVEFRIELVPESTYLAPTLFMFLAPYELKDVILNQLKELMWRSRFILPSRRRLGAPVLFVKMKERIFPFVACISKDDLRSEVLITPHREIEDYTIHKPFRTYDMRKHLKIILGLLKKEKLYAKFSKCDFWLDSVQFLSHVINSKGIHVDPSKIEAIKNWGAPTTPTEKNKKYDWGEDEEEAFQMLKKKLCSASILALPEGGKLRQLLKRDYGEDLAATKNHIILSYDVFIIQVDLGTVSRSRLIVGVFYLFDFSFDLLLTVIETKDLELGKRRKLRLRMTFVKTNEFHSSKTMLLYLVEYLYLIRKKNRKRKKRHIPEQAPRPGSSYLGLFTSNGWEQMQDMKNYGAVSKQTIHMILLPNLTSRPRRVDPYVMVKDNAPTDASRVDFAAAAKDSQPSESRGSLRDP